MDKLTQDAHWRQQMLQYCRDHGLTKTTLRYRISRKSVWKWRKRWDGTWYSLLDRKRSPHTSPRKQSPSEEKLVKRYGKKYRDGSVAGIPNGQGARIYAKLWLLQTDGKQAAWQTAGEKAEEA
jgi:hypothetical protein